jgi:hypothetical protein
MRKLILAGIISVLVVIAFISYLKYDTQRFMKELSSTPHAPSPPEQQVKDTAKDALVTPTGSIKESTTEHEKASLLSSEGLPAGTSEDVAHPNRLLSNTEKGGDVLESGQTPADTELSPEVVALYTDLQPLYDEYTIVGLEYMQVMTKMHESVERKKEITQELNATSNPETEQALRIERKQLQTWIDANYSTYRELRDETDRRVDAMETFLNSRGYSSRDDFDWKTFFTWRGELSR